MSIHVAKQPMTVHTVQNLPTLEMPLKSTSSHGFEFPHGDFGVSQLSMQFDHIDDLLSPPAWLHSHDWPEPQLSPQQIQVQSLPEHSASPYDSHGTQNSFEGQASHQIQSREPSENPVDCEGKYTNWNVFYFQVQISD